MIYPVKISYFSEITTKKKWRNSKFLLNSSLYYIHYPYDALLNIPENTFESIISS